MNRLFAIGDVHGCFTTFYELVVRHIDLKKDDRLILLGDYIDRGEASREVVDFIIDLVSSGFDVIPLRGNHEEMLLDSFVDPAMFYLWQMNSGETTLSSFGVRDVRDLDDKYIEFFTRLKYFESFRDFYFVHAGFNDALDDPFNDKVHMIWESLPSYHNPVFKGKTIVHGHRPKTLQFVRRLISEKSEVIPIDTGCVYGTEMDYGYLSALEINTMNLISVQKIL